MANAEGKVYFVVVVEYSGFPTEQDKVGCDGLYIKSVESYQIDKLFELEMMKLFIEEKAGKDGNKS